MKSLIISLLLFMVASSSSGETTGSHRSVLHGTLFPLDRIPDVNNISNVSLTEGPNTNKDYLLNPALFKKIFRTANPFPPDLVDKRQSAPWYSGTFNEGEKKYQFMLDLNGLGFLIEPSGHKGSFSYDYLLCSDPANQSFSGCWRIKNVMNKRGECDNMVYSFMQDGSLRVQVSHYRNPSCEGYPYYVQPLPSTGYRFFLGEPIVLPENLKGHKFKMHTQLNGEESMSIGIFSIIDDRLCFSNNFFFEADGWGSRKNSESYTLDKNKCLHSSK